MKKTIAVLAIAHTALTLAGAFQFGASQGTSVPATARRGYETFAGTGSCYSFFAPSVAPASRVMLTIKADGREFQVPLSPSGHESQLRMGSITFQFLMENDSVRREMAASWAARAFAEFGDARGISISVEIHDQPTMEQYRQGVRATWKPIYTATFEKAS